MANYKNHLPAFVLHAAIRKYDQPPQVRSNLNLKDLLERRMHTGVKLKKSDFKMFKGFKIIRSTELIYVAWKKGFINFKGPKVLDALLWAMKSKGCAITEDEIEEIKRLR